ncbi:MAG: TrmH family RNA methyltransferase [Chloroflexota bacterium]
MRPDATLTSSHNPRFRAALALREARDRRATGRILVDGGREIGRALAAGIQGQELWLAPERLRDPEAEAALAAAEAAGVPFVEATPELLARLAFGDRDDGLVLVADAPSTRLADLALPPVALVGVLEAVEKPGNLGAILRSADGAGLDALVVADPRSDPWNPNCIRASLGAVFSVPLAVCSAGEALDWARARGLHLAAARVDGSVPYTAADLTGPLAIVLGSEADGLSPAWSAPDVTAIHIPMRGRADSLNVSVSAAILFYEALRQRTAASPEPA